MSVLQSLPTAARAAPHGGSDPIPALWAENCRIADLIDGGHFATEAEADGLMDLWGACEAKATATRASTPAGAIASIEWALDELRRFGFDPFHHSDGGNGGENFTLALLDGALDVLRGLGGAA